MYYLFVRLLLKNGETFHQMSKTELFLTEPCSSVYNLLLFNALMRAFCINCLFSNRYDLNSVCNGLKFCDASKLPFDSKLITSGSSTPHTQAEGRSSPSSLPSISHMHGEPKSLIVSNSVDEMYSCTE
jgi:hypothetical protein